MDKRTFLKKTAIAGLGGILRFDGIAQAVKNLSAVPITELAGDEDFWASIRKGYRLKPDYVNLENGYYNFVPEQVLEKFIEYVRKVNYEGSNYMRHFRVKTRLSMAARLAPIAGCSPEELILTRNATESLDLIISGIDWNSICLARFLKDMA
jgi:selenocysteine lyase/cysteine desulfurase